jgi:hypothetical protein
MKLKSKYATKAEIPAGFESLFEEQDGEFVLTGIEGVKTDADIARLQESLRKERSDHKETKERLAKFANVDAEKIHDDLDELEELRALKDAGGEGKGVDQAKIDELVQAQVKRKLAPVERERDQAKSKLEELTKSNEQLQQTITTTKVHDALRAAATKAGVTPTAVEDILLLGERTFEVAADGAIVTKDGLPAETWLSDQKNNRPHWWAVSQGAGARGNEGQGAGANPWAKDNWNLTKQGEYVRQHGVEKAKAAAQSAGVELGSTQPMAQK